MRACSKLLAKSEPVLLQVACHPALQNGSWPMGGVAKSLALIAKAQAMEASSVERGLNSISWAIVCVAVAMLIKKRR